jgi:chemotaxis signal transduction protein
LNGEGVELLAAELRSEFDRSFARAYPTPPPPQQDLLAVRVADHDYMVSLDEVLSIHADRKVVPLPTLRPALLGLVGVRGSILPVYDLRQLLGYPKGTVAPRWLISVRAPGPFTVAFERLDGHLRLPRAQLLAPTVSGTETAFIRGSVTTESGPRPLLDLAALFAVVTASERRPHASKPEETR